MTLSKVASALFFLAAIPLTWICVFFCYRDFRADRLRCALQALRDRLHDSISPRARLESDAASVLESWLRAAIACASHLTGSRFLLFAAGRRLSNSALPLSSYREWCGSLEAVSEPRERAALTAIETEMRRIILSYMSGGSPLLWLLLPFGFRRRRLWTIPGDGFLTDLIVNTAELSVLKS